MASIVDQMTTLYVFVDDYLKAHPSEANWRTSPNARPAFTDAEVITIGLMQGCLGVATLKKTYRIIAENYRSLFPKLPCYAQWISRLHQLTSIVGRLIHATLAGYFHDERLYVIDSKPIPLCNRLRHGRVRLLRDEGAYFGKSSAGWYFGFKLHALIHIDGTVLAAVLTPANGSDPSVALALAWGIDGGIALVDEGYKGRPLRQLLEDEADLLLVSPKEAATLEIGKRALICSLRERVETTFSGLWDRFIDRVYSRSWNGLWNTVKLKLVHYNLSRTGLLPV